VGEVRLKLDTPRDCLSEKFLRRPQIILAPGLETGYITSDAEVVELVDTLCSGRSVRKDMWVQIPPSAPIQIKANHVLSTAALRNFHYSGENSACQREILGYIEIVTFLGAGFIGFGMIETSCHFKLTRKGVEHE
jgi:hypothetical protein